MAKWLMDFWQEHGERHTYFLESWIVLTLLYYFLDPLRPQIEGLMIGLAMLWVKQVRGFVPLGEEKPKDDEPK